MTEAERPEGGQASIARLGVHTAGSKVVIYALGAVGSILIARALGPTGRGRYEVPVTIATVAFWLGNLGAEQAQLRAWSRRQADADAFVTAGAVLAVLLGVATALVTAGVYALGRHSTFAGVQPGDLTIVLVGLPIMLHRQILTGLLTLAGRLRQANVTWVVGAVAQTAGIVVLFAADRLTVTAVLVLFDVSFVVPWLLLVVAARGVGRVRRRVPWAFVRAQLRLGVLVHPYVVFLYLTLRLDVFLVARYRDLHDVGLYAVAVTLAELPWLVTDSLVASATGRQASGSEEESVDVTLRAVRMSLLLWVVVGGAIAIGAPVVVRLLYGPSFADASHAVWALLPAAAGMAVWRPVSTAMLRLASPWLPALMGLGAVAANVAANVALTPRYGIVGAGLASVVSYWLGAAAGIAWLVRRGRHVGELVPGRDEVRRLRAVVRPRSLWAELSYGLPGRARRGERDEPPEAASRHTRS